MRIAFLSTFYPFRGGIAQFNEALFHALQNQGNEVKAFTFTRQYPDFLFPGKTQYVEGKESHFESLQLLDSINPISYYNTAKAINQYQPDLLVMGYWMSFFGPSLGKVARLMNSGTKVISVLHNVIPHEPRFFDKPFTNYFLNSNDGFVVMTEKVQADLKLFVPGKPAILKPHPLYTHFGEKINQETAKVKLKLYPDKETLLFFGFIRDYKGLDILIEAFEQLDQSYQLVIAGEVYGSFEKYQQQIINNPNKDRIKLFNDYISDQDVPLFFSAADVLILPYKSATQSGVTAISYHFDLPIIATDVGGLRETVLDGKTGRMIKPNSPKALSESIVQYFDACEKEKFLPEIERLKKEWSWDSFAKELVRLNQALK